jgi:hypothetical protein
MPFKPWLPMEVDGDPHSAYAYATAEASAKERGADDTPEV